jgi:hypothetical protein
MKSSRLSVITGAFSSKNLATRRDAAGKRGGKSMKTILAGVCMAILALGTVEAVASDRDALEIEGSYVLYQEDGYQRVLSFDRSGNAVIAADLESAYGFTTGIGAWEQTGPDSAKARILDFNYKHDTGQPAGPAITDYEFTFSDLVQGKYRTFTGTLSGNQYDTGQDPLAPTSDPVREFDTPFTGKRITAE